jgi:predicted O-methyltransferase YrrM
MKTLVEICSEYNLRHDVDWDGKIFGSTDKESYHKYCSSFYDHEFIKYKTKPIKLLEIGVQKFGSMLMWNHYFTNPQAEIYGVDIDEYDSVHKIKGLVRLKFLKNDAYDQNFVNKLPMFDIIIDDGPHTKESQMRFIELYLPKLNKGGVLVIEDILDFSWITDYTYMLPESYFSTIIDARKKSNVRDSLMFIVRK